MTAVVQLGMGGSILGARLAHAFGKCQPTASEKPSLHFYSGADLQRLGRVLAQLDPASTLVIAVSKSGNTVETSQAFDLCCSWLGARAAEQCFAVSSSSQAFSLLPADHRLGMSEAVGGRYSIWSSAGLGAALALGKDAYQQMLAGGARFDDSMRGVASEQSLPVRLAVVDAWHRLHSQVQTRVLLTYDHSLDGFTDYVQQLDMESLGKPSEAPGACGVTMGGYGCDIAHSYLQWLFQAPAKVHVEQVAWHQQGAGADLAAAQRSAHRELASKGGVGMKTPLGDVRGGHAVSSISPPDASAQSLGMLIALYEYRTIVQGWIWDVNPFDQYGVELAKQLAAQELND